MIRLYESERSVYVDESGEMVGLRTSEVRAVEMIVAMGSERAIDAAHAAALSGNIPFVVVLDSNAEKWGNLGELGFSARHAVRHATIRLTDGCGDAMNELLGTDDFREIDGDVRSRLPELLRESREIWARPAMVFHAPFDIPATANSASRVRPRKMREEFRQTYRVIDLSGSPKDRANAYHELRALVRMGVRPQFAYSENSTQPNIFASPTGDGFIPGLEPRIFRYLRKEGIPVGQFYRDVYWKFADKTGTRRGIKARLYNAAYAWDLKVLETTAVHVFLPSMPMAKYLPELSRVSELPPASEPVDSNQPEPLKLLYVGGLGPHYRLHEIVQAMVRHPQASLTICIPADNWQAMRDQYEPLPNNVVVRHESGERLRALYDDANAGVLFVEPDDYWGFAVPMKFYEYQAHGKAVIATSGTYAGALVTKARIGEAVPYTPEAIDELLIRWQENPDVVKRYVANARDTRGKHTWAARARTVTRTLIGD